jgi:hypothetical protein
MMTSDPTTTTACDRHPERPSVAACQDCTVPLCGLCEVDVPSVGSLCVECAQRRAGLHHRPLKVHEALPPTPPSVDQFIGPASRTVRHLEERASQLDPPQLIGGLTERLGQASLDREGAGDVHDDDREGSDGIDRLQDLARADAPTHRRRWWPGSKR